MPAWSRMASISSETCRASSEHRAYSAAEASGSVMYRKKVLGFPAHQFVLFVIPVEGLFCSILAPQREPCQPGDGFHREGALRALKVTVGPGLPSLE